MSASVYITAISCNFVHNRMGAAGAQVRAGNRNLMLTTQRKKLILARLERDGQLIAKDLAREFDTSEDTIRRDLRELAHAGKLQRVHGGALPASAAIGDLQARQRVSPLEKIALGRFGAAMIERGQVVILD